jgi:hypothetical protein
MSKRKLRLPLVACAVAAAVGVLAAPAFADTLVVEPGDSIQAAIDAANPGDTILVKRGTYRESLHIQKNGITLRGRRAKLVPPATPPGPPCNQGGTFPGICVLGQGNFQTGTVTVPVRNVRITGLTIRGFSGDGIVAFGANGFRVDHNRLVKNGGYGVFSLVSKRIRYLHNLAKGNAAPGFYVGDSPAANALIARNVARGNHGEGILMRHTSYNVARRNLLVNNCAGILALADAPGPATHIRILRNVVRKNNLACPGEPDEDEPPISGFGIALLGAGHSLVSRNLVTGHRRSGPSFASGGILVQKGPGGTAPRNDVVKRNVAVRNHPKDIKWDRSGVVRFRRNTCGTSAPPGLCAP